MDMELGTISGPLGKFFRQGLFFGYSRAEDNQAKSHYMEGEIILYLKNIELISQEQNWSFVLDAARKESEGWGCLQGFQSLNVGSGFGM